MASTSGTEGLTGPNQSRVRPDVIVITKDGDFETKILPVAMTMKDTFIWWNAVHQKYMLVRPIDKQTMPRFVKGEETIFEDIPERQNLAPLPGIKVVATATGQFDDLTQFRIGDYPEALTAGYVFAILDGVAVLLSPATNQPPE